MKDEIARKVNSHGVKDVIANIDADGFHPRHVGLCLDRYCYFTGFADEAVTVNGAKIGVARAHKAPLSKKEFHGR